MAQEDEGWLVIDLKKMGRLLCGWAILMNLTDAHNACSLVKFGELKTYPDLKSDLPKTKPTYNVNS